jgi:uncharacterized protein (DUF2147 family)
LIFIVQVKSLCRAMISFSIPAGVSALALTVLVSAGTALADPRGLWLAQDGARVRVSSCGKGLCATIASTKSRIDPTTGASWTDKNNPDPGKRNRPLVGVEVLGSTTQDEPGKWSGWLYNTDNGQTYTGHLIEIDPLGVDGVWAVVATHPSGQQEHIVGFHSEAEAKEWRVGVGCEAWLRTRGYAGWELRKRMRLKRYG